MSYDPVEHMRSCRTTEEMRKILDEYLFLVTAPGIFFYEEHEIRNDIAMQTQGDLMRGKTVDVPDLEIDPNAPSAFTIGGATNNFLHRTRPLLSNRHNAAKDESKAMLQMTQDRWVSISKMARMAQNTDQLALRPGKSKELYEILQPYIERVAYGIYNSLNGFTAKDRDTMLAYEHLASMLYSEARWFMPHKKTSSAIEKAFNLNNDMFFGSDFFDELRRKTTIITEDDLPKRHDFAEDFRTEGFGGKFFRNNTNPLR